MSDPSCHACGAPIALGSPVAVYHAACDTAAVEALANVRADVAHLMRQIDALKAGRDALAAEVLALTADLLRADEGGPHDRA